MMIIIEKIVFFSLVLLIEVKYFRIAYIIYCWIVCFGGGFWGDETGERPRATQTDVGRRQASIFTAPGLRNASPCTYHLNSCFRNKFYLLVLQEWVFHIELLRS